MNLILKYGGAAEDREIAAPWNTFTATSQMLFFFFLNCDGKFQSTKSQTLYFPPHTPLAWCELKLK